MQGSEYSVASDIWSLGLSLLEVSLGVFPLPPPDGAQMVRIFGEKIAQDPVVIAASQRTPRSAAAYSSGEGEYQFGSCILRDDQNCHLKQHALCSVPL